MPRHRTAHCARLAVRTAVLVCAIVAPVQHSAASCGAAFCMVNTSWSVQGAATDPGLRLDLRYEYIDQFQPRHGSGEVGAGQIRQHHDEVRTINRNWLATAEYTFNERWGVSATVPLMDRSHGHIHNHQGAALPESWNFSEVGDVRLLGRRQWQGESLEQQRLDFYGVNFGLKLPTGRDDIRNGHGQLAERTLQPGTGTTDLLLGGYFKRLLGSGSSWFADALVQRPFAEHDGYRPGSRVSIDLGYRREAGDKLAFMLQLNTLYKSRDRGPNAEEDHSGGKFIFVSPGVSYLLTENVQVYSFVQIPLYQYVNGVQLTADWAVVAGISTRF